MSVSLLFNISMWNKGSPVNWSVNRGSWSGALGPRILIQGSVPIPPELGSWSGLELGMFTCLGIIMEVEGSRRPPRKTI